MKNKPYSRLTAAVAAVSIVITSGIVPATASAASSTAASYSFNTAGDTPAWSATRYTVNVVPSDDSSTTTLSGDKGVLQFVSAGNVGNGAGTGYSRCEYDFSELVEGAESYTVSYKVYFNPDMRGVIGLADKSIRTSYDRNTVSVEGMIGQLGHFDGGNVLRREPDDGDRGFLSSLSENCWINVTTTVEGDSYTSVLTGTATTTETGTLSSKGITSPTTLEMACYSPGGAAVIELDDLKITVSYPAADGTSSVIKDTYIDYAMGGTGDWSYNNGIVFTDKTSAVHFEGIPSKDEAGYGTDSITVPLSAIPDDTREIKLYTDVQQSYDMAQGLASYSNVTVGGRTVRSFAPSLINDSVSGIDLGGKTPFATLTFSTADKKRYVQVNGGEKTEIENGNDIVVPAADLGSGEDSFDLLVYVNALSDSKLTAGALGELKLNYKGPEQKLFSLEPASPIDKKVASTPSNGDKYYFGQLNATDLSSIAVSAKSAAANDMKINFYALQQQAGDLSSAVFADADKIGTASIAKGASSGTAQISKTLGDNMYIYGVVSALDGDGKGVAAAEVDTATFGYKSIALVQSEVQLQYFLQNTKIDSNRVMPEGVFSTDYYNEFSAQYDKITELYNAADSDFSSKFMAEYTYLEESKKGWDVVKSISENLSKVYEDVNAAEDKYAKANESRDTIFAVQDEYEALSTATAQKFVGQFNYSQLKELNDILVNGDAEIVASYAEAINIVWDTEKNKSRITQENYLINSGAIETLRERYNNVSSYPQQVQDEINKYDLENILAAVDSDVNSIFMPATAEDFKTKFAVVKEAYEKAETYDGKYAAVYGLNDLNDIYVEIKSSEYRESIAGMTDGAYEEYEGYITKLSAEVLANVYLEKVNALKSAIAESQGVTAEKYEVFAAQYNEALKAKQAYEASGETPVTPETESAIAEANEYMDAAARMIDAAAETAVATAKAAIDDISTVENTVDSFTKVKLAQYHFNALGTNGKAYLSGQDKGDSTYGKTLEEAVSEMSGLVSENEKSMQALFDKYDADCVSYTGSLNYTSDKDEYTVKTAEYESSYKKAAESLDKLNRTANGSVRYDSKNMVYVVDSASASALYTSIERTYKTLADYTSAITALKDKGMAYSKAIQSAIDFYYDGEGKTYADFVGDGAIADEAIAEHIEGLYDSVIDYYLDELVEKNEKGEVTADNNTEAAKNTNNIRTAVNNAKTAFANAVSNYSSEYMKVTGAEASDLDLSASADYITMSQEQADAYSRIENTVSAKLSSEYDKDMEIQDAKEAKETAAKAEVDELVSLINELYTKVSSHTYTSEEDIEADRMQYAGLSSRAAADVGNVKFVYSDETGAIDYFKNLYPAEADSKLAYIDTTLTQWANAWVVVSAANALDVKPIKEDGSWTVNDATEFSALSEQYNALTAAEKANVDAVVAVKFDDRSAYITLLNGTNTDYANKICGISDIISKSTYAAAKDQLEAVNAYVKALNDTISDDKASEADKAAAQSKLDVINTYYGEETSRLTVLNNQAVVIAPAYSFDTLVDDANALVDPEDTSVNAEAINAKLSEAEKVYDEMIADSKKYVTNYALYEALVNKYGAGVVTGFADGVNSLDAGTYTAPNNSFAEEYQQLMDKYDAMSDSQKAKVSSQYALLAAKKTQNDNVTAAVAEAAVINNENLALTAKYQSGVTTENYAAAKAEYEAQAAKMNALDEKYPVYSNVKPSAAVTNTMEQLKSDISSLGRVMDTITLINAIGAVDENSGDAISAARAAYDALTADEKTKVSNYAMLVEAENTYNSLDTIKAARAQADVVSGLISAIGVVGENSGDAITAARTAYDALSELAKSFVTNYDVLTQAEEDYKAFVNVEGDIDGDGSVTGSDINAVIQSILGKVELTAEQKSKADLDGNGVVNVLDLLKLISIW